MYLSGNFITDVMRVALRADVAILNRYLIVFMYNSFPVSLESSCNFVSRRGGGLMTTFGDLGNYVNGFTCSPQEI